MLTRTPHGRSRGGGFDMRSESKAIYPASYAGQSRGGWLLVGAIFVVLSGVAGVWLALDRRPPEWDHANHLEHVVNCAQDMARADVGAVIERSSFYPPLALCAAGLAYSLAPSDVASAQAVILLFLGLGIASVYVLARSFTGVSGAVVAALLFGSANFVVYSSLRFQLDLPLAAMVAVALVLVVRVEDFSRLGWSIALGAVLGLGMLTKPPFPVYVLPALLVIGARTRGWRSYGNIALAVITGGAVAVRWYGPRLIGIFGQIEARSFRQAAESGHAATWSLEGLLYYPKYFVPQFGLVAALCVVVGCVVAARRRQWLLLASLIVPFLVFEMIQNKNLRYTLPILPVAAVLGGIGFDVLRRPVRTIAAVAIALAAVVQVAGMAFGVPSGLTMPLLGVPLVGDNPPLRAEWPHRKILTLIASDARGSKATVSVVPNYIFFSVSNFRYYALRDGLPFRWTRAWDDEPIDVEYMILKNGDQGPEWTAARPRRIAERLAQDRNLARVFPVIGEFPLPDGSTATVRARRIGKGPAVSVTTFTRRLDQAIRSRLPQIARDIDGLSIRITTTEERARDGRVARVELEAQAATVGDFSRARPALLRVHDLRVVVEDVLVNPFSLDEDGRLDPLDAGGVRFERATILSDDVSAFLRNLKGFTTASVRLGPGSASFAFSQFGPDVRARVRILPGREGPIAVMPELVSVGGLTIPAPLVNWVVRNYDPSPVLAARAPVRLEVGRIAISPDAIKIGQ
jgi:dolichyl-phosphate-mannose-protein mannosyltransferase